MYYKRIICHEIMHQTLNMWRWMCRPWVGCWSSCPRQRLNPPNATLLTTSRHYRYLYPRRLNAKQRLNKDTLWFSFWIMFCAGGQTIRECELYCCSKADNRDEAFSEVSTSLVLNGDRSLLIALKLKYHSCHFPFLKMHIKFTVMRIFYCMLCSMAQLCHGCWNKNRNQIIIHYSGIIIIRLGIIINVIIIRIIWV